MAGQARSSCTAPRTGSTLDALLNDACVLVSLLMQHGIEPKDFATSMGRLGNAEAASVIGAVVDLATIANSNASQAAEAQP